MFSKRRRSQPSITLNAFQDTAIRFFTPQLYRGIGLVGTHLCSVKPPESIYRLVLCLQINSVVRPFISYINGSARSRGRGAVTLLRGRQTTMLLVLPPTPCLAMCAPPCRQLAVGRRATVLCSAHYHLCYFGVCLDLFIHSIKPIPSISYQQKSDTAINNAIIKYALMRGKYRIICHLY